MSSHGRAAFTFQKPFLAKEKKQKVMSGVKGWMNLEPILEDRLTRSFFDRFGSARGSLTRDRRIDNPYHDCQINDKPVKITRKSHKNDKKK